MRAGGAARQRDDGGTQLGDHHLDGPDALLDDRADRGSGRQRVVDGGERRAARHRLGRRHPRIGGTERLPVPAVHEHVQRRAECRLDDEEPLRWGGTVAQFTRRVPRGGSVAREPVPLELGIDRLDTARRRVLHLARGAVHVGRSG